MATGVSTKKVQVKLLKHHTHEGVEYKPGDVIELWDDQVEWLASAAPGTAEPLPDDAGKGA